MSFNPKNRQLSDDNQSLPVATNADSTKPSSKRKDFPVLATIAFIAVSTLGLASVWLYTSFLQPDSHDRIDNNQMQAQQKNASEIVHTIEDDDEGVPADEEPTDFEPIFQMTMDNILQTKNLAYTYNYFLSNRPEISTDNAVGRSTDTFSMEVKYRFRARNLEDYEHRIVQQDIKYELFGEIADEPHISIDFSVMKHKNNLYVKLLDMSFSELSGKIPDEAITALQGKWLKFTFINNVWVELESDDFYYLRDSETGYLLQYLHWVATADYTGEGAVVIPLHFWAMSSYMDSPFAFGYLDDLEHRQRIYEALVHFGDDSQSIATDKLFVINDCVENASSSLTCQIGYRLSSLNKAFLFDIYEGILDSVHLSDIVRIPPPPVLEKIIIGSENIIDYQGEAVIDTDRHLPVKITSKTSAVLDDQRQITSSHEIIYESFDEDLELVLPSDVTSLSDLQSP